MTWKQKALLMGVLLGALTGAGAALLYIREVEDEGLPQPKRMNTGDALKVGLSLFALIRQVSGLGR